MAGELIQVLLVEDNPGDARLVAEMLREDASTEFRLTHVTTVKDAVDFLTRDVHAADAILLDLSLPDEHGLETVRRVVAAATYSVVVVMTGAGDDELGNQAVQAGAQDYLVKGQVDSRLLRRALRFAIERQDAKLELQNLSIKDDLTGLYNRRGFLVVSEQQFKMAKRNRSPFLILFMDLDGLKYVNDTFGHAEGNRALVEAANVLRDCFRQSDVVARLGGDEFAALAITNASSDQDTIKMRLDESLAQVNGKPDRDYPLGFSIGMLCCQPDEDRPIETLLEQADALMYEEKLQKRSARPRGARPEPVNRVSS